MRREASIEEWRKLYELGKQFKDMQPWKWMGEDEIIAVEFSPEETGYFVVMGEGGFTFGFSLYFGTDGFNMLLGLVQGEEYGIEQDYFLPCQDCITMLLGDKEEVSDEQREVIRHLGLRFHGKNSWIYFDRCEPGYFTYLLNQEEVLSCTRYLEKFLEALEAYREESGTEAYDMQNIFSWHQTDGRWQGSFVKLPVKKFRACRPVMENNELVQAVKKCKKTNDIWEFDSYYSTDVYKDEKYDKPLLPRYYVLMDHKNDIVIEDYCLEPEEREASAADFVANVMRKHGQRPKKILVPNIMVGNLLADLCDKCQVELKTGEVECCRRYQAFTEFGDAEELFNELEELGFDTEKMKRNAQVMSEEEFTDSMLDEMLRVFGDLEDEDEDEDDYIEHFLPSRTQKITTVREFFDQSSSMDGYQQDMERTIVFDWAADWKELLRNSPKKVLYEMAVKMGALVDEGYSKDLLVNIIMSMYQQNKKSLKAVLDGEDVLLIKFMKNTASSDEEEFFIEDFPFSEKRVRRLIDMGLVDVKLFTGNQKNVLVLKLVDVFEKMKL